MRAGRTTTRVNGTGTWARLVSTRSTKGKASERRCWDPSSKWSMRSDRRISRDRRGQECRALRDLWLSRDRSRRHHEREQSFHVARSGRWLQAVTGLATEAQRARYSAIRANPPFQVHFHAPFRRLLILTRRDRRPAQATRQARSPPSRSSARAPLIRNMT
jgi:hypothetical protein